MSSPLSASRLIRIALGLGITLLTLLILWVLLSMTDQILSVWQGLERLPGWVFWLYCLAILGILVAGGYAFWKLLRSRRAAPPTREPPLDREALERRLEASVASWPCCNSARGPVASMSASLARSAVASRA